MLVFLSYSSKNVEAVKQFQQNLERAGLSVWRDKDNLRGGEGWLDQIENTIKNDADIALILLTKDSVESEIVEEEARLAVLMDKAIGIFLENPALFEIPGYIGKTHILNLSDEEKYKHNFPLLLRDIFAKLSSNAVAELGVQWPECYFERTETSRILDRLKQNNTVLLWGAKGQGKTTLATGVAAKWNINNGKIVTFKQQDLADAEAVKLIIAEKLDIHANLADAIRQAPPLLIFDDIDDSQLLTEILQLSDIAAAPKIVTANTNLNLPETLIRRGNIFEVSPLEREDGEKHFKALSTQKGITLTETQITTFDKLATGNLFAMGQIVDLLSEGADADELAKKLNTDQDIVTRIFKVREIPSEAYNLGRTLTPRITAQTLQSLSGLSPQNAENLLEGLQKANFIYQTDKKIVVNGQEHNLSYYDYAPFIHSFMIEQLKETETDRVSKAIAFYVQYAQQADGNPALLEAEYPNLREAVREAYKAEQWEQVNTLALALWEDNNNQFLANAGHLLDAQELFEMAATAAAKLGNAVDEARHLKNLSVALMMQGAPEKAIDFGSKALEALESTDAYLFMSRIQNNLALFADYANKPIEDILPMFDKAIEFARQAEAQNTEGAAEWRKFHLEPNTADFMGYHAYVNLKRRCFLPQKNQPNTYWLELAEKSRNFIDKIRSDGEYPIDVNCNLLRIRANMNALLGQGDAALKDVKEALDNSRKYNDRDTL
jgi:DNA polymerase III delta prime subunit